MKKNKNSHPLQGFKTHGVDIVNGNYTGDQYITTCPFCQREGKFYVNIKNKCWDCKVCGLKGNYVGFLRTVAKYNIQYMKPEHLDRLAEDRQLPVEALQGYSIGFDGNKFTIPYHDIDGKFCGLKNFYINMSENRFQNQSGITPSLYLMHRLKENTKADVFLCEGEWDAMALNWLLRKLEKPAIAVAVPSAHIFNPEWGQYFYRRNVTCLYDNDDAGKLGEEKAYGLLKDIALSLQFVHWPTQRPEGFDTRDHVAEVAFRNDRPRRCWRQLREYTHNVPRSLLALAQPDEDGKMSVERRKEKLKPISFDDLVKAFKSYLYLTDTTPIKIVLATILANRLDGEMLWMFLVAPPSSAKSEFIQSLDLLEEIFPLSGLTVNTLSSGFIQTGKKDASILPQLNGRVMTIKDFTGVLTMLEVQQREIFGQLRDAYDGKSDYYYGHGQNKHHKAKFGLLAGVTEVLERLNGTGQLHTALGERFLRYRLPKDFCDPKNLDNDEVMLKMHRAAKNTGSETKQKEDLRHAVKRFIEAPAKEFETTMPEELLKELMYLARFTARLRGFVDRDRDGRVNYKPGSESPIRLFKQLYRLAVGLAMVEKKTEVDVEDIEIVKRVALDTCPSRIELFVRTLHEANMPLTFHEISARAEFHAQTVKAVLDDLEMLGVCRTEAAGNKKYYALSNHAKALIRKGAIYPETGVNSQLRIKKRVRLSIRLSGRRQRP